MASTPKVTVLLPVYNGRRHVMAALDSVTRQSEADFEVLVVDDGSTDSTRTLLADCARRDHRVRVISQPHAGTTRALNTGLAAARGRYIARMDADDLARPTRFRRQVEFLDAHPDVGICGSSTRLFRDGWPVGRTWRAPTDPEEVRGELLFAPPMAHPSVMMRRDLVVNLLGGYDENFASAEDYDLWTRAAERTVIANLPDVLLDYRRHPNQVTARLPEATKASARRVRDRGLDHLGIQPTSAERRLHDLISDPDRRCDAATRAAARQWIDRLAAFNTSTAAFREPAFSRVLSRRWRTFLAATGVSTWRFLPRWAHTL